MRRAGLCAVLGGVCLAVALCAPPVSWLQVAAVMGAGIAGVMGVVYLFHEGGSKP